MFRYLGLYEPTEVLSLTTAACTIHWEDTIFGIIFSPTNRNKMGDMATFIYRTYDWRYWLKHVPTDHKP